MCCAVLCWLRHSLAQDSEKALFALFIRNESTTASTNKSMRFTKRTRQIVQFIHVICIAFSIQQFCPMLLFSLVFTCFFLFVVSSVVCFVDCWPYRFVDFHFVFQRQTHLCGQNQPDIQVAFPISSTIISIICSIAM